MDPLSDMLTLVKPRAYASGGMTAGGRWSVHFRDHVGIKCYLVAKGECWIALDSLADPIHVTVGEGLLLPQGRAFRLCSDPAVPPVDARTLVRTIRRYNGIIACGPGDDVVLLGSHFAMDGNAGALLGVLPPVVHLRSETDKAALRGSVEQIMAEMREPRPGGSLIAQQSAYTMLVLALRLYIADGERGRIGWLAALADQQIAGAMAVLHEQPARAWTVQTLAATAGMSRTTFAQRFRETVGESPMEYLTRWRMLLAADRLLHSNDAIAAIARSVGYESESAFGAAFKRTMGESPRGYGRNAADHGAAPAIRMRMRGRSR